jgi:hypothetical protein
MLQMAQNNIMLRAIYAECRNVTHYAAFRYVECHFVECCGIT